MDTPLFRLQPLEPDRIREGVAELDEKTGWYQNIHLGYGIQTKTRQLFGEEIDHPRQRWESIEPGFPASFVGKSVLDTGCNAGFFGFVAAQRGAARLVGIDGSPKYVEQAKFCAQAIGLDAEYHVAAVNDIAKFGQFDITLCIGLLYHVRDILGAIEAIAKVTKEMAIVESAIHREHEDLPICFTPPKGHRLPGSWHPTMTWLRVAFERYGFTRFEDVFVRGGRGGLLAFK